MQKEIVVVLMGAGRAGREHAANLCSFPDVRVALICDPILDLARLSERIINAYSMNRRSGGIGAQCSRESG
jgi:predicted dehydrogenase